MHLSLLHVSLYGPALLQRCVPGSGSFTVLCIRSLEALSQVLHGLHITITIHMQATVACAGTLAHVALAPSVCKL